MKKECLAVGARILCVLLLLLTVPAYTVGEPKLKADGETAEMLYRNGSTYYYGLGVVKDINKAINLWEKSARKGLADAQYRLGILYDRGGVGLQPDPQKSLKWYEAAAQQGHTDAQLILAEKYAAGSGVAQNYPEAYKWCRKAAERGNTDAQCMLSVLYCEGMGIEVDYVQAYMWCKVALAHGGRKCNEARLKKLGEKLTPAQVAQALEMERLFNYQREIINIAPAAGGNGE